MAATWTLPLAIPTFSLPRYPKANKATGMDGIAGRQRQLNLGIGGPGRVKNKKYCKPPPSLLPYFLGAMAMFQGELSWERATFDSSPWD